MARTVVPAGTAAYGTRPAHRAAALGTRPFRSGVAAGLAFLGGTAHRPPQRGREGAPHRVQPFHEHQPPLLHSRGGPSGCRLHEPRGGTGTGGAGGVY